MSGAGAERAAALVAEGDPEGALEALQEHARARPEDAAARVFLFQLLAVLGQWRRAGTQLDVAADLDAGSLLMAQTYRECLRGEAYREAVFAGRHPPLVLGEPPEWLATLLQALPLAASGDGAGAAAIANEAFERAEARGGRLLVGAADAAGLAGGPDELPAAAPPDGTALAGAGTAAGDGPGGDAADDSAAGSETIAFEWLGDADMRLGPVLEAVLDGKYYWIPFERLASVTFEPPTDLRDLVWLPATFGWPGGGETVGFVPTRYPLAANGAGDDDATARAAWRMARRTDWADLGEGFFVGRGQRLLASSAGDHPLLECRAIVFDADADADEPADSGLPEDSAADGGTGDAADGSGGGTTGR